MGIYLFKRQTLFDLLLKDPREDFGKHLIRTQMEKNDVHAYLYGGYWEDIGTIDSYYHANLALTNHDDSLGLQCYDEASVIMTKSYRLPGAKGRLLPLLPCLSGSQEQLFSCLFPIKDFGFASKF